MDKERTKCERFSRICGYLRPLQQWNVGKQAEWEDRKMFEIR
jgi:ribonucleoside-triphosphate reductase